MRIETYFSQIRDTIERCTFLGSSSITYDKRSTYIGFIRGELHFVDGSVLFVREFVDVEEALDRLTYAYHYIDPVNTFVFRYDNSGHHRKLGLSSYPHHKHQGHQDNIVASVAPDLAAVLQEIEQLVELP